MNVLGSCRGNSAALQKEGYSPSWELTALVSTELSRGFAWPWRYVFHTDSMNCAVIFVSSNHSGTRFQPHGRKIKAGAELESLSKKLLGEAEGFVAFRQTRAEETASIWVYKCTFFFSHQKVIILWLNCIKIKFD